MPTDTTDKPSRQRGKLQTGRRTRTGRAAKPEVAKPPQKIQEELTKVEKEEEPWKFKRAKTPRPSEKREKIPLESYVNRRSSMGVRGEHRQPPRVRGNSPIFKKRDFKGVGESQKPESAIQKLASKVERMEKERRSAKSRNFQKSE